MPDQLRYNVPFTQIPNELVTDDRTGPYHIAVFCALAMHSNGESRAWPSVARLSDLSGASRNKVKGVINDLVEFGWITKHARWNDERGCYTSNVYVLQHSLQGRAPGGQGVGHDVPQGRAPGGQEQEPLNKNHTELDSGATAPAVRKPREPAPMKDELAQEIQQRFLQVQQFENWGRERAMCQRLATICRRRMPEDPMQVLEAMLTVYERLRESGDRFWRGQPYTPSMVVSQWERIEANGQEIMRDVEADRELARLLEQ